MTRKIEFLCTDCGNPYYVRPCDVKKRKTTLCRSCMLKRRNQTPKMRKISRKNGSRPKSTETRKRLSEAQRRHWTPERKAGRSGSGNPAWTGGRTLSSGGYIYKHCPGHPRATQKGNYVFEHIIMMENHLGRYLCENEVVHHINENRIDNRVENLLLCASISEHTLIHHEIRKQRKAVK